MANDRKTLPYRELEIDDDSPAHRHKKKKKDEKNWGVPGAVLIVCLMTLPLLVFLCSGSRLSSTLIWLHDVKVNAVQGWEHGSNQTSSTASNNNHTNGLIDGLISPNFDKESCLSRYESALYYKTIPYMPSSYLKQKLRNYEALHKKCGPNTPLYKKSIEQLNSGHSAELMDCNYVVWIPYLGLGNRILTLVSTFLYAILTNKVMLIQATDDMVGLFCEPFPDSSWILPPDFPIKNIMQLDVNSNVTYRNMLNNHVISNDPNTKVESLPSYAYVHLSHDVEHSDRLFYCNEDQYIIGKFNWLLLHSDLYFVPSLYSTPMFEEELGLLFPAKESVFYLLAHYLIHPTNSVWGLVTRYYNSYLSKADEKIGIQIRIFHWVKVSSEVIFQQILDCSNKERVLPELDLNGTTAFKTNEPKSKAILVASLYADYYERFKSMYYEHSVKTWEFVSVYQPSHEERQKTEIQSHNQKALAEIYLLSLCDVLMTTAYSTFGYIGYGLAGIKPIFLITVHDKIPDPPCVRAVSMEPCNLTPLLNTCTGKTVDKEKFEQHVKQCEDVDHGIKLFD
ncbi:fucosyltransferase 2 [Rhynchospora pubera]|uniref:Fucosyltransferase n=1 Tax=Rhynchospora pubera TaxID=906938 RepID=A0AAV8HNH9_9POAL|nr:fucosyltransferase 2 [Rhynchospora pubera]